MKCAVRMEKWASALAAGVVWAGAASAQGTTVYRCPGNPVLYTDALSAKEAKDRNCSALEGAPVTVLQGFKPRAPTGSPGAAQASGPAATRIDPNDQRARDSDARRILEAELKREEDRLAAMKAEYNNGEPERRGDEKNYQKYIDRVAELKAGIARKEGDIVAIRRELAKTPQ